MSNERLITKTYFSKDKRVIIQVASFEINQTIDSILITSDTNCKVDIINSEILFTTHHIGAGQQVQFPMGGSHHLKDISIDINYTGYYGSNFSEIIKLDYKKEIYEVYEL